MCNLILSAMSSLQTIDNGMSLIDSDNKSLLNHILKIFKFNKQIFFNKYLFIFNNNIIIIYKI
jgi:hypothetical protein